MDKKSRVFGILDSFIPRGGVEAKGPELIFYCPFCDHHKRKLQVNVDSQQWHCWVCDAKGRSIFSLVNQIKSVESIKYNGIPLEIPITKIKIWFLLQYNFKKFPNIFVEFLLFNTILII